MIIILIYRRNSSVQHLSPSGSLLFSSCPIVFFSLSFFFFSFFGSWFDLVRGYQPLLFFVGIYTFLCCFWMHTTCILYLTFYTWYTFWHFPLTYTFNRCPSTVYLRQTPPPSSPLLPRTGPGWVVRLQLNRTDHPGPSNPSLCRACAPFFPCAPTWS